MQGGTLETGLELLQKQSEIVADVKSFKDGLSTTNLSWIRMFLSRFRLWKNLATKQSLNQIDKGVADLNINCSKVKKCFEEYNKRNWFNESMPTVEALQQADVAGNLIPFRDAVIELGEKCPFAQTMVSDQKNALAFRLRLGRGAMYITAAVCATFAIHIIYKKLKFLI